MKKTITNLAHEFIDDEDVNEGANKTIKIIEENFDVKVDAIEYIADVEEGGLYLDIQVGLKDKMVQIDIASEIDDDTSHRRWSMRFCRKEYSVNIDEYDPSLPLSIMIDAHNQNIPANQFTPINADDYAYLVYCTMI